MGHICSTDTTKPVSDIGTEAKSSIEAKITTEAKNYTAADTTTTDTTTDTTTKKFTGPFPSVLYIINGFYMGIREKYTESGEDMYYYEVEWDSAKLSWEEFRSKFIGATDPSIAAEGSLRRCILEKYEEMGLTSAPNVDVIHASASPFEGLCERLNWLRRKVSGDEYGRAFLEAGIRKDIIEKWARNPKIDLEGKKVSLFDSLEDMNADECLKKSQRIAGVRVIRPLPKITKNQAFMFIKPRFVTQEIKDFVVSSLEKFEINIVTEGTLDNKTIEENKLVDNHYYSIAKIAGMTKPEDLNLSKSEIKEFHNKFGVTWGNVLSNGIIYNAMDACEKYDLEGEELNRIWGYAQESKNTMKFGEGFDISKLSFTELPPSGMGYPGERLAYDFTNQKWIDRHTTMYHKLDKDSNGSVELGEFIHKASVEICANIGASPEQTVKHTAAVTAFFGPGGLGMRIGYDMKLKEYLKCWEELSIKELDRWAKREPTLIFDWGKALFDIIDSSGDDAIDLEEWELYQRAAKVCDTVEDCADTFKVCDQDGNGKIELKEMTRIHVGFWYTGEVDGLYGPGVP